MLKSPNMEFLIERLIGNSLIYVKNQGWKIDDVEFVGQLTGRY